MWLGQGMASSNIVQCSLLSKPRRCLENGDAGQGGGFSEWSSRGLGSSHVKDEPRSSLDSGPKASVLATASGLLPAEGPTVFPSAFKEGFCMCIAKAVVKINQTRQWMSQGFIYNNGFYNRRQNLQYRFKLGLVAHRRTKLINQKGLRTIRMLPSLSCKRSEVCASGWWQRREVTSFPGCFRLGCMWPDPRNPEWLLRLQPSRLGS